MDLVQWPAMVVTIGAAWGAGSTRQGLRRLGFWLFLLSNALWVIWGVHANAYALIVLQLFLTMTNIRGARNNDPDEAPTEHNSRSADSGASKADSWSRGCS